MTGILINNPERTWNSEKVELLKKLWTADGITALEISRQIPGTTRNAIIGKAHRLGLPKKGPSPYKPRTRKPKPKREEVVRKSREPAPFQDPKGALVPFIQAGPTTCRSIQGRGDSDGHDLAMFCPNPKDPEVSFCPYHMRHYYNGSGR